MGRFLSYAISGVPYGCDFAIVAVGLILTYRATGVFNFAFGAQAYVSAFVFDVLDKSGLDKGLSFLVAVVLLAPALGLAFNRFLFRHIAPRATTAKIVTSLGLFVALPNLVGIIFGNAQRLDPPSLLLSPDTVYLHVGSTPINGNELATVILTAVSVAVLAFLMRATRIGLKMRAAVESPRLARLEGINADGVISVAWAVSSLLAGLAGVLLAPLYAAINPNDFTVLVVTAIMVAAIGGLKNMPVAVLGGIVFGIVEQVLFGYLPTGSILQTGVAPALPFVILVGLLIFHPGLRHLDDLRDPLASVEPPLPPLAAATRAPQFDRLIRVGGPMLAVVFVLSCVTWVPGNWEFIFAEGLVYSAIFLSITMITGLGGQLSLCQAAFAGVGAFTAGQLAAHFGVSVLLGALLGAVLAGIIGALVALPALRLQGLALALLTLAFALLADNVVFPYSWAGGPQSGLHVPRPVLGPGGFGTSSRTFFGLTVVLVVVCGVVVGLVRRGTLGRYLAALRNSPTAAASIGIDLSRTKITVFALSAALAGLGGGIYASLNRTVSATDFNNTYSLVFVVVVVTTGVRTIEGAIQAGMAYVVLQQLVSYLPTRFGGVGLVIVLFAFGATTYAKHPEGIVEFQKRRWTARAERLLLRGHSEKPDAPAAGGFPAWSAPNAEGSPTGA